MEGVREREREGGERERERDWLHSFHPCSLKVLERDYPRSIASSVHWDASPSMKRYTDRTSVRDDLYHTNDRSLSNGVTVDDLYHNITNPLDS